MKINSRSIKILNSLTEIGKKLTIGNYDLQLLVTGDIVKVESKDNQDGTIDIVYVLKASDGEFVNKKDSFC